jgi:RHS repeat-associated protein
VVQATDYGVWGDVLREQKTDESTYRFGFQGQFSEKDLETGWNHFELREYDPVIGRMMMTDPYGEFWSPYLGMGNDPVNWSDPDGGCISCWATVGQVLAEPATQSFLFGATFLDEILITPKFDRSLRSRWGISDELLQAYPLIGMQVMEEKFGLAAFWYRIEPREYEDPRDEGKIYQVNEDGYATSPQYVGGTVDLGAGRLKGAYTVYKAIKNGKVVYWGITKNFAKRALQHGDRFDDIIPVFQNVSKSVARGLEQIKIETHGLKKLENIINSVGTKNPKLMQYYKDAISYLKTIKP